MKKVHLFLLSACILSIIVACNLGKNNNTENGIINDSIVKAELSQIDMNEVDSYPLFEECTNLASKEEQKACFEKSLADRLSKILSANQFTVKQPITDTILVVGTVSNEGYFVFEKILCKDTTRIILPKLDSVLEVQLGKLTSIKPALKRGIQVSTQFKAPIVVDIK